MLISSYTKDDFIRHLVTGIEKRGIQVLESTDDETRKMMRKVIQEDPFVSIVLGKYMHDIRKDLEGVNNNGTARQ